MSEFDICWADVPYQESDESKWRPVLVLNDMAFMISAFKITSQGKTSLTQLEIQNWRNAGLDKPSYICVDRVLRLKREQIGDKIGELQIEDIYALQKRLMK